MDRAKRVAELQSLGYVAHERDWALGETIVVTHPTLCSQHGGIELYREVVYVRLENGAWLVTELHSRGALDAQLDSWDDLLAYLDRRLIQRAPSA